MWKRTIFGQKCQKMKKTSIWSKTSKKSIYGQNVAKFDFRSKMTKKLLFSKKKGKKCRFFCQKYRKMSKKSIFGQNAEKVDFWSEMSKKSFFGPKYYKSQNLVIKFRKIDFGSKI